MCLAGLLPTAGLQNVPTLGGLGQRQVGLAQLHPRLPCTGAAFCCLTSRLFRSFLLQLIMLITNRSWGSVRVRTLVSQRSRHAQLLSLALFAKILTSHLLRSDLLTSVRVLLQLAISRPTPKEAVVPGSKVRAKTHGWLLDPRSPKASAM